jgi:hypothetical protein
VVGSTEEEISNGGAVTYTVEVAVTEAIGAVPFNVGMAVPLPVGKGADTVVLRPGQLVTSELQEMAVLSEVMVV